jgi:hypothetical protein
MTREHGRPALGFLSPLFFFFFSFFIVEQRSPGYEFNLPFERPGVGSDAGPRR